jgi:peptide/nickel transport system substrate-binding protein
MINRTTKLRWRRKFKRSRRQVEDISQQAESQLDRHFFKKLYRLGSVRRFVAGWAFLMAALVIITVFQTYALTSYYQKLEPVAGGAYYEGMVGVFSNSNPLFATSVVDTAVSKLIFPGLLKYNQQNQLVGDLAQSWAVDETGTTYTVILKDNLMWQDGIPLTAQDVVFTYQTIQNPDVQSPLFGSWRNIKVTAVNGNTVQFVLPNPLTAFPQNLTNGIVPEHVLSNTPTSQLRSANFNNVQPIGSGPYKLSAINVYGDIAKNYSQKIGLVANNLFYGGRPKLDQFVIDAFSSQSQMLTSFEKGDINSMVGLDSVPANLQSDTTVFSYNIPITADVMVFFRNDQPILSDTGVRQALIEAIDESKIINGLGFPVIPSKSPLLPFQVGYDPSLVQLSTNLTAVKQLLTNDGWIMGNDGIRYKAGKPLEFSLYTQDNSEYNYVAQALAAQWKGVGVKVQIVSLQTSDLQTAIASHSYDAILYGISIGVDPDVFAYWDSSQAAPSAVPGLNLSLYKSSVADKALEQGRTRSGEALRQAKYKVFLSAWQADAPALALYQPRFLYVTRGQLFGFNPTEINNANDIYSNVQNWETREVKTTD